MTAPALTASLILKLEDKLSAGIAALQAKLEKLSAIGRRVGLQGLEDSAERLSSVSRMCEAMSRSVSGIGGAADGAAAAVGAMGEQIAAAADEGIARMRALGRSIAAVSTAGAGAGGGGFPRAIPLEWPGGRLAIAGPGGGGSGFPWGVPGNAGGGGGGGGRGRFGGWLAGAGGGGASYARGVVGAARGFGHSLETSIGQAFGIAMGGFGLFEAMRGAGDIDNILRHMAIARGLHGPAADALVGTLYQRYRGLGIATNQSTKDIAEGAYYLQLGGLNDSQIDVLTRQSARIATAFNANPRDVARMAFSLAEQLHVGNDAMGGTLAAMARAGTESHFTMANLSEFFPTVAAMGSVMGYSGRAGVERLTAMLAIAHRNTATPGEAATNMKDFLQYINAPIGVRSFRKMGIDLPGLIANAKKAGVDPIEAVLAKVRQATGGDEFKIGALFHNQEAGLFVKGMLQHFDEYRDLLKKLQGTDESFTEGAFAEGMKSMSVELKGFETRLSAVADRLGFALKPGLEAVLRGMDWLGAKIAWVDQRFPGLIDRVLLFGGGAVALAGALGLLGIVFGPVLAGFRLMLAIVGGPVRLIALLSRGLLGLLPELGAVSAAGLAFAAVFLAIGVVLGAIAYDIVENWRAFAAFFQRMWRGIGETFQGSWDEIAGLLTGDWPRVLDGFEEIWSGIEDFFSGLWGVIKQLFWDFVAWIDGWTGGAATAAIEAIKAAWSALSGFFSDLIGGWEKDFEDFFGWIEKRVGSMKLPPPVDDYGRPIGGDAPAATAPRDAPSGTRGGGEPARVHVTVDGPGRVTGVRQAPGVTVTTGPTVGRP